MNKNIFTLCLCLSCIPVACMEPQDPLKNKVCSAQDANKYQRQAMKFEQKSNKMLWATSASLVLCIGMSPLSFPLAVVAMATCTTTGCLERSWRKKGEECRMTQWACMEHQKIQHELSKKATLNDKLLLLGKKIAQQQATFDAIQKKRKDGLAISVADMQTYQQHVGLMKLSNMIRGKTSSPLVGRQPDLGLPGPHEVVSL